MGRWRAREQDNTPDVGWPQYVILRSWLGGSSWGWIQRESCFPLGFESERSEAASGGHLVFWHGRFVFLSASPGLGHNMAMLAHAVPAELRAQVVDAASENTGTPRQVEEG